MHQLAYAPLQLHPAIMLQNLLSCCCLSLKNDNPFETIKSNDLMAPAGVHNYLNVLLEYIDLFQSRFQWTLKTLTLLADFVFTKYLAI